jgi:hypothetical protein
VGKVLASPPLDLPFFRYLYLDLKMDTYTHLPGTNFVSNTEKLLSRGPLFHLEGNATIMSKKLGVGDANNGGKYFGGTHW